VASKYKKFNVVHDFNLKLKMYSLPNKKKYKKFFKQINLISLNEKNKIQTQKDNIFIYWGNRITLETLKNFKNLKWIHLGSSACDPLIESEAKKKKILITKSNEINSKPVAMLVLAFILFFSRGLYLIKTKKKYNRNLFDKNFKYLSDLSFTKILIVGKGSIAKNLKKILTNVTNDLIIIDKKVSKKNFYKNRKYINYFKKSQYIINTLPYNRNTYRIFNDQIFKNFNKSIFINVGRGETVDENSLLKYLKLKKISFAALDVFDRKNNYSSPYTPLKYSSVLWNKNNVFLTPHIASFDNRYWDKEIFFFKKKINEIKKKLI
jgi:D-2-hydroxyacid dehydrogenase (NADP+)